ncbi:MAG: hypothetical protein UY48_C0008G0040 [Candidatus Gottesmanbacteria bacterium GW2011_GWB1_49_7]|uniref:Uncharacterized protein n=1 Tax=Candidatus Gottesmanbacteria bacterium GW2011_GWB1_49_7 TaxID=1618448 RepID=A0A0G1W2R1_9BACT|nr:MAG: hypothetical protein UY48_C0008G0040 [Candidatus Gottesmanbacteria bacterium GW2011_GWB1_49_7]
MKIKGQVKEPPPLPTYIEQYLRQSPKETTLSLYSAYLAGYLGESSADGVPMLVACALGQQDRLRNNDLKNIEHVLRWMTALIQLPQEKE